MRDLGSRRRRGALHSLFSGPVARPPPDPPQASDPNLGTHSGCLTCRKVIANSLSVKEGKKEGREVGREGG